MKKSLLICSILLLGNQFVNAQSQLLQESFETDGEGTRYTSNPFQASCDFFIRDNNTLSCLTNNPTGLDGSYYWTGEDTDTGIDPTGILTLNALAVTGFTLDVDVLLGIGRFNDFRFETLDELLFQYNMDGGGWVTFGAFYGSNDGFPGSTGNLVQDTDLNGAYNPGAPEINSSAMQNFNFTIPATGNSVQVRFITGQDGGTEETIIDNIRINGTSILGIDDNSVSFNNVLIYPNPNNGLVNIDLASLKDTSIKMYNALGQLIYHKKNITSQFHQFKLDKPKGLYFIEISSQDNKQTYKLVIK